MHFDKCEISYIAQGMAWGCLEWSLQSGCYFDTSSQASKDDMHPVKHLADDSTFEFYWWMFHKNANTTSYFDPEMSDT